MSYLSDIQLDDRSLHPPKPEIEQERKVAIFDLLEKNKFWTNAPSELWMADAASDSCCTLIVAIILTHADDPS